MDTQFNHHLEQNCCLIFEMLTHPYQTCICEITKCEDKTMQVNRNTLDKISMFYLSELRTDNRFSSERMNMHIASKMLLHLLLFDSTSFKV